MDTHFILVTSKTKWFYLQGLQIAFLWVTQQGGDPMIISHTANIGVPPQRENLTNDGHPPQRAMNQLHDVWITHLLKTKMTQEEFNVRGLPSDWKWHLKKNKSNWNFSVVRNHDTNYELAFFLNAVSEFRLRNKTFEGFKWLCLIFMELKYEMTVQGQQSN